MSKKFLISEDDRQSILSLYKNKGIIFEEEVYDNKTIVSSEPINDHQVAWNLEKDINKIILGDEREGIKGIEEDIFGQMSLKFLSGGGGNPTTFSFLMNRKSTGQTLVIPNSGILEVKQLLVDENISVQKYLKPIYENPDYKILFEKYPQLKRYIESFVVEGYFLPGRSKRTIRISFELTTANDPYCKAKTLYKMSDEIPLGKIMTVEKDNGFSLDIGKRNCGVLEIDNAETFIPEFKIPNPLMPEKKGDTDNGGDDTVSIQIILDMKNPFQFNKTILYPDGEKELQKFVTDVKEVKNTYGEEIYNQYINFLRSKKIDVIASSSIDDDPNQIITYVTGSTGNSVDGCQGTQTRNQYNQCLSEKRAEAIIKRITELLPELSVDSEGNPISIFVPRGIGETDQFDKGQKWPDVEGKTYEERTAKTANNRIVSISLPLFKTDLQN